MSSIRNKYYLLSFVHSIEIGCALLIRISLVFLLFSAFGMVDSTSFAIYTTFTIIADSSGILGSYLANSLLTLRLSWICGWILCIFGSLLGIFSLNYHNINLFYVALSVIAAGTGIMKCNSMVITNDHLKNEIDPKDHNDYNSIMHFMAVVASFIIIFTGGLILKFGNNQAIFYGSLLLALIVGIIFIIVESEDIKKEAKEYFLSNKLFLFKKLLFLSSLTMVITGSFLLFSYGDVKFIKHLPLIIFILFYLYLLHRSYKYLDEAKYIYLAMIFSVIFIFYISIERQRETVFALFLLRNVDRVIMNFEIPVLHVNSLYALIIAATSAVFFKFKIHSRLNNLKVIIAIIFFTILAFANLYLGCLFNKNGVVNLNYYILSMFLMAICNCFTYTKLVGICRIMPHSLKNIISSFMIMNISAAAYIARLYADFAAIDKNISDKLYSIAIYQANFLKILIFSMILFVMILIIGKTKFTKFLMIEKVK